MTITVDDEAGFILLMVLPGMGDDERAGQLYADDERGGE